MTKFTVDLETAEFQKYLDEAASKAIQGFIKSKVTAWDFNKDIATLVKKHFDERVEALILENLKDADMIGKEIKKAITTNLTRKINKLIKDSDDK